MNQQISNEFSLRDLLRILDRRRRILTLTVAAVFTLAVLACLLMTRRYQATGVFEMQKSSADSLDLEDMMSSAAGGASDSLSVNTDLETLVGILQSDTLALQVIRELNLQQNNDFKVTFTDRLIERATGWFEPKGRPDPAGASLENSPNRRSRLLKVFSKHLDVKVDSGTRLITVSFTNCDPKVAAAVTNHLIQALVDYTFQTKYKATAEVSDWLQSQLDDLRKQSEDLQAKVVALQQSSGIFGVGGTDLQGKPVVYSPVLDQLQQNSAMLTEAEINRVIKESIYKIAQTRNPATISQLAGTTLLSTSGTGLQGSLTELQNLQSQEAALREQIGQDAALFGPAYPKLISERASLKSVEVLVNQEIGRIASRARNDYEIAVSTENGTRANFDANRKKAEALNDKTIQYMILSRESEDSQDLYQDLLKRLKEAGILEGLKASNLTNVDIALPPARPTSPNVPIILLAGLFGGLVLGGGAALLADAVDNKVRGTEEIEDAGIPLLGIVPSFLALPHRQLSDRSGTGILLGSQYSEFAESIRRLRSNLLIARSGVPPQVLLITSGNPGEGKTTISINLSAALAQYGKRVLLLEADLRRPVLKDRLPLKMEGGLSTLLSNRAAASAAETIPDHPNLAILQAGPVPPYPSELLGSTLMHSLLEEWRQEFDFIVIDSPPILPVADSQTLAAEADATVLVARSGIITRVGLRRTYSLLIRHAKNPAHPAVGVLLNAISTRSAAYYGYYGSYSTKGYYGSKENPHD
ncbi:MAG: polysaccharide biosynthesis tyrosine autokinase [Acidobacteriaceae bacterium]